MRDFLDACHEIETVTAEVYRKLSVEGHYPEYMRETFLTLASDELAHARQIDLLRQTPECEQHVSNLLSWDKVAECLAGARGFLRMIGGRRLEEKEALKMAVVLEERFIKVHAHNALDFTNTRLEKIFAPLAAADQLHLDRLQECLERWLRERKPQVRPMS